MIGGTISLEDVKERHKLYNKLDTTKEEKMTRRKHINYINKMTELEKKGQDMSENIPWAWLKEELAKGEKIKTPSHLIKPQDNKIKELEDIIIELRAELDELKKPKEEKEEKEAKPIIKGELEEIEINGIKYKKSKIPFVNTEKYYLFDIETNKLIGIYNAITKKINKPNKKMIEATVLEKEPEKPKKQPNKWIVYVKEYAKKNNLKYMEALKDPKIKEMYNK
jgi:hypothetical protein